MRPVPTCATNTTLRGPRWSPLPALVGYYSDGVPVVETAWRMTWIEWLRVLVTRTVYVQAATHLIPPIHVAAVSDREFIVPEEGHEDVNG